MLRIFAQLTEIAMLKEGVGNAVIDLEIGVDELSFDMQKMALDRILEDGSLCQAVVNDQGEIEPDTIYGRPVYLVLKGTEKRHLYQALREDQDAVERCLAEMAAEKVHRKK